MDIKTVGVVGYGHFGEFAVQLVKRFLPEVEVRVYSQRSEPDGELFFSLEETVSSDVVILCGRIAGYEEQLQSVIPHLGQESVVVDVATVKKYTSELFKRYLGDRKYFCCHPMFGAESYKKTDGDVSGYRIVVTDFSIEEEDYEVVKNWLIGLGFSVIEMSADEYDQLLADTLFLTHYIGQTIKEAGFGRTSIDTVSFHSLMNAVESVVGDTCLFHDVYRFNPYCKKAAKCFHDAQEKVFSVLPKK